MTPPADSDRRPPTTTDAGIPVASEEHSLTVGPDGLDIAGNNERGFAYWRNIDPDIGDRIVAAVENPSA